MKATISVVCPDGTITLWDTILVMAKFSKMLKMGKQLKVSDKQAVQIL